MEESVLSDGQVIETRVKQLLDLLPLYVRSDVRSEVQKVVVPYIRYGGEHSVIADYIAQLIVKRVVRHGFYKVLADIRRGNVNVRSAYSNTFEHTEENSQ